MSLSDVVGASLSSVNPSPFLSGWLQSRRWRLLLTGVPVAGLLAGIFALRYAAYRRDRDGLFEGYLAEASQALAQGDEVGAKLRLRRAALVDAYDSRVQFGLATLAEKQGQEAEARQMMERLVNDDSAVGVQAAKWLLDRLSADQRGAAGGDRRRVEIRWLEKIHAAEPANLNVRVQLASRYAEAGQVDRAIEELRGVVAVQPQLRIPLIQFLLGQGRKAEALMEAEEAERVFRLQLKDNPDARETRLLYASVLTHQERFREAMQVLEGTKPDEAGATTLQYSISSVAGAWAEHLERSEGKPEEILQLTSLALRTNPSNQTALSLLMRLAREAGTRDEAVQMLEGRLAAGVTPWLTHLILGSVLLEKGDAEKGKSHLEQAVELNPAAAVALNNLAWTLANNEPVDLERAETLVSKAVEMAPQNVHFRETRGQVLLKLGRWKEALSDLEAVLPTYSKEKRLEGYLPMLHGALAEGYEGLGNTSMAAQHRKLASAGKPDRETPAADATASDPPAPKGAADSSP